METVKFEEQPRIGNRTDAVDLLEQILQAEKTEGLEKALVALLDAIKRGWCKKIVILYVVRSYE